MFRRLADLITLTRDCDVRLTVVVDRGACRVTFKRPGARAETVADTDGAPSLDVLLEALLKRFRSPDDSPTGQHILDEMTARQRERCIQLIRELRDLKRAALMPIEELEPVLASPRSALHPQHFDASHDLGGDQ